MERLFDNDGGYTETANRIDEAASRFLKQLADSYPEVDVRDLGYVLTMAAVDASTMASLSRRSKK